MFKKSLILLSLMGALFVLGAEQNISQNHKSIAPFLIVNKMPHMTKTVKQHWNSSELNLSAEQKIKLLSIRKETMSNVMRLKPEVNKLENEIVKQVFLGYAPKVLKESVEKLAKLKAEATLVHIKCINDTNNILSDKQLDFIKGL